MAQDNQEKVERIVNPQNLMEAMQGMEFVNTSMGGVAPVAATKPFIVPEELPEAWGGRPRGTSRRAIRMQEEYDKRRKEKLQEQQTLQQMDIQQKQFEMSLRDQKMQEDEYYYNRGLKEAEQKLQAQQKSEASAIINSLNQIDPRSPDYAKSVADIFGSNPLGASDPNVQKIAGQYNTVNSIYMDAMKAQVTGLKDIQEKYVSDMQKLLETGVKEEELPQYYDPNSPVGVVQFDPKKVATRLGTSAAEEKAKAQEVKEETPKQKIGLDLQQAYGELNEALMSGAEWENASSKVAGLRARYKAATGEDAPEVLPQPKTPKQRERLPSGSFYIDPQGNRRQIP